MNQSSTVENTSNDSIQLGKRVRKVNSKFTDYEQGTGEEVEKKLSNEGGKKIKKEKMQLIDISLPPKRERKKVKYDDYISPKAKKAQNAKKHRNHKKSRGNDSSSSSPSFSPRLIHIQYTPSENELDPPSPSSQSPPQSPPLLSDTSTISGGERDSPNGNQLNEAQGELSLSEINAQNEAFYKSSEKKKKLEEKLMALNQDLEKISSILNEKKSTPRQKKTIKKEKRESKDIEMDLDSEINNIFKPIIETPTSSADPTAAVVAELSPAKTNSKKLPNTKPSKAQNKKIIKDASPLLLPPSLKSVKNELEIDLSPALLSCQKILRSLMKHKYSFPFLEPVDPIKLGIPDYLLIIKNPMDFGTIKEKLEAGKYANILEFSKDVNLVFDNACTYNQDGSDVYIMSDTLRKIFQKKFTPVFNREKANLPPDLLEPSSPLTLSTPNSNIDNNNNNRVVTPTAPEGGSTPRKKRLVEHQNTMTREEKRKLANRINKLTIPHLNVVVEIVKQCFPEIDKDTDEIAIDVDALDPITLRDLESFVNKIKRKNKAAKHRRHSHAHSHTSHNDNNNNNSNSTLSKQFDISDNNNDIEGSKESNETEEDKSNENIKNNNEDNMVLEPNQQEISTTPSETNNNNNFVEGSEAMVIEQQDSSTQCLTHENVNNNNLNYLTSSDTNNNHNNDNSNNDNSNNDNSNNDNSNNDNINNDNINNDKSNIDNDNNDNDILMEKLRQSEGRSDTESDDDKKLDIDHQEDRNVLKVSIF